MTDILQTIEEIISNKYDFKIPAIGGTYFLEETKIMGYPKTILKQKGKMLIYSFDREDSNDTVFSIFNSSKEGLTKLCDYIVFYPKNETLYTFICEQKTSQSSAKHQVEAGWLLADYILKTASRMMRFKALNIEYRALVFSKSPTAIFSTSIKQEPYVLLENSLLKNKLLRAGDVCYLDNLCF